MQDQARQAWFKSVILPHEAALRKRVRRMATTPDIDVDDVVSEALMRAYATADYARIDQGRTFLFTIARNLLTDLARRRAVVSFDLMANLESLEVSDEAPSVEAAACAREELQRLQRIVEDMPAQRRRVLLLRRIEDLSLNEIAVQLGIAVSTVEKHLSKAIEQLTRGMAESDPVSTDSKGLPWRSVNTKR